METEEEATARKRKADNELMDTLLTQECFFEDDANERAPALFEQRMAWDKILDTHGDTQRFTRHLRMTKESFMRLLEYIKDDLLVDESQASRRGGVILPEICLYCTIRYLAGGIYSDICLFAGISQPSFYRVVWKTMKALCLCQELRIVFPQSEEECAEAAEAFTTLSTGDAITNCVSCCDGYLLVINTPNKDAVNNVRSYFSGHYQRNGVNVQAACDHLSRFTYFAVAGPGVMGDDQASTKECDLRKLIEQLPPGYVVIGDAAYKTSEHLVCMYHGHDRKNKDYDNFNFYASQLRIRIEMAFGLMYKKWGILWRPVQVKMERVKILALTIATLHNYCIDERIRLHESDDPARRDTITGRGLNESYYESVDVSLQRQSLPVFGMSMIRESMVNRIKILGLIRPSKVDAWFQPRVRCWTVAEWDAWEEENRLRVESESKENDE
jgi:DDE superfamily endonuclease